MDNKEVIKSALDIGEDWDIDWLEVTHSKHRLDVWLTPAVKRGFFGGRNWECTQCGNNIKLTDSDQRKSWRHLNLGALSTYLNTAIDFRFDCPQCGHAHNLVSWGASEGDMTEAMEKHIAATIPRLPEVGDVCEVLNVTIDEVLEVQRKLDLKPWHPQPDNENVQESSEATNDINESNWLPDETHPAWIKVLDGSIELETDALPLQFMINRLKLQFNPTASSHKMHEQARLLRRYFLKYRQQSARELQQIFS